MKSRKAAKRGGIAIAAILLLLLPITLWAGRFEAPAFVKADETGAFRFKVIYTPGPGECFDYDGISTSNTTVEGFNGDGFCLFPLDACVPRTLGLGSDGAISGSLLDPTAVGIVDVSFGTACDSWNCRTPTPTPVPPATPAPTSTSVPGCPTDPGGDFFARVQIVPFGWTTPTPTPEPPRFDVIQITDNDTSDWYPAVSGSNVVWQGYDGNDWEIYFWDGSFPIVPVQITDNDVRDDHPAISGSNVVWERCDGGVDLLCDDGEDWEIYLWDGSTVTQITDNTTDEKDPAISGSNVVWLGWDGSDYEIYLWDGSTVTQITDNDTDDWSPAISGSNVVWYSSDEWDVGDFSDYELYRWNGSTVTQITDNTTEDEDPAISGLNVVWEGCWGYDLDCWDGDWEIHFWDGFTVTQITDNDTDDSSPAISGSNVVWQSAWGSDDEIWFWDGSFPIQIQQITDNSTGDSSPVISGLNVVWSCQGEICMTTISGVPTASPTPTPGTPTPTPTPTAPIQGEVKMKLQLKFDKPSKDKIQVKVKGWTLPAGVVPTDVTVNVGGAAFTGTIDAKGNFKSPDGRDSIVMKQSKKTQLWKITVKRKNNDFAAALADEGLTNADNPKSGVEVTVPLTIEVGGATYSEAVKLFYMSKLGKKGTAK